MADEQQNELDEARMPFLEHLRELRTRLRNAVIALIVGFGIAYTVRDQIFAFLISPLAETWMDLAATNEALGQQPPSLNFIKLHEAFWAGFSISLWAGIFVSSPFVFHQLWKFVAPGLYKHERRYGISFAAASAVFFVGGAAFCYYFVVPQVFDFFLSFSTDQLVEVKTILDGKEATVPIALKPTLSFHEFLSLERKLLLGFGLVFELPLLIFFLSIVGVVTHRGLWRFNRWWIVLSFVLSAALTPPDVISQIMMAGPLVVLYNASIGIAYLVTIRRERKQAAYIADDPAPPASDEG